MKRYFHRTLRSRISSHEDNWRENYTIIAHTQNTVFGSVVRDDLCVNKSQFVPVIFEPPCIWHEIVKVDQELLRRVFENFVNRLKIIRCK
jgi:hypothetical protein